MREEQTEILEALNEEIIEVENEFGVTNTDYEKLRNKPSINGVTLDGDKTGEDLGLTYDLPVAGKTTLGGIKVGNNLTITEDGTLSAVGGGEGGDAVWGGIVGNIQDQTDLQNELGKKCEKVVLWSDGDSICTDEALLHPLTFEQVKALVADHNKIVVVHNSNYELRFSYKYMRGGVETIWFNATTELHGEPYMYRIIINSLNEVTNDEVWLAEYSELSAEIAARQNGDNNLQQQINNIPHYELPTATATRLGGIKVGANLTVAGDGTLNATGGVSSIAWGSITGTLTDQTDLKSALDDKATVVALGQEEATRANAISNLQTQINGKATTSALTTETTNRENGDIALQGQIDAITSKTDIVDIVGTKAALDEYVTTDLGDNDIIKVLTDETHNNAPSYYRWNKTAGTWNYVGSEAPAFTKAEAETLFVPKTRTINNKALDANVTLTTSDLTNDSGFLTSSDLTNYVKNTDYASTTTTGVVKASSTYAVAVSPSNGNIYTTERTYTQYVSANQGMFIGKATLENVITGKGLVSSEEATKLKVLTQSEYEALTPAEDTLYFIKES